jgi:hypothetical protein
LDLDFRPLPPLEKRHTQRKRKKPPCLKLINRHDPENKPPLARVRRIAAPPFEPNLADLAALSDEAETHRLVRQAGGRSSPIVLKWQENAAAIRARNGHEFTLREMLETLSKSERSTYWVLEARRALGKPLLFEPV